MQHNKKARAIEAFKAGGTWAEVAESVGVERTTLTKNSRRQSRKRRPIQTVKSRLSLSPMPAILTQLITRFGYSGSRAECRSDIKNGLT